MFLDSIPYLNEILTMSFIAIFMAISPGSDFVMVTRNSIFYGRKAGLYSALGISTAVWFHVAYSIAGLAVIISNSIILFSILKYLGAAYLIYIGWKTFTSKSIVDIEQNKSHLDISNLEAFKTGFISNVLNPKTTIFFLSIFTQVVTIETPIWIQLVYGMIISFAHLIWFITVSYLFTHPILLDKFYKSKKTIERIIGSVLIAFGLKVALTSNN
ncbi:LysE family translocator [Arcobacter sp. LA11]|uniref:LysE family translocator n=1 Tax=Arcobacter sp. LA11 TaxID=1898176 RepID=UPI0009320D4E|nr:LysE family transporter [Arcobacter sp. LA11]